MTNVRGWLASIAFFVVVFVALSTIMLIVNLATNTARGLSGNAVATVLAGLLMVRFRWQNSIPHLRTLLAFSPCAGFSAVLYLYILYFAGTMTARYSFAPLTAYELLAAFIVNTLVLAATLLILRAGRRGRDHG